jgi:hypothetical protein
MLASNPASGFARPFRFLRVVTGFLRVVAGFLRLVTVAIEIYLLSLLWPEVGIPYRPQYFLA